MGKILTQLVNKVLPEESNITVCTIRGSSTIEEEYPKSRKGLDKYSLEKYWKTNVYPS